MPISYEQCVAVFKALADETRLKIAEMLSQKGEMCGCHILREFKITQPTLSYHIKILADCGLVHGRREGTWIQYSLNPEMVALARNFLETLAG